METAIKILVQIFWILEDIIVLRWILQVKFAKGLRAVVGYSLLTCVAVWEGLGGFGRNGVLIVLVLKMILLALVFQEKIGHIALKTIFVTFYMGVLVDPVYVPYQMLCRYYGIDWKVGIASVVNELLQIAVLVIAAVWVSRNYRLREGICRIPLKYYGAGFLLGFITSGVWEIAHHILKGQPLEVATFYEAICLIFTEFMYLFGIILVYVNDLRAQYQRESQIKGDLLQIERAYEQTIKQNVKDAKVIRHDMKHHLGMIRVFLERKNYAQLEQYLSQIEERVRRIGISGGSVGNVLADAVIEDQRGDMEEDMKLVCEGKLPGDIGVDDYDLCVIFANLLSNAREACEKLKYHEKVIRIRIYQGEHRVKLEFSNPVEWEVDLENLGNFTTKEDKKEHGYGLRSVQNTVRKYGGEFEKEVKGGILIFRILFYKTRMLDKSNTVGKTKMTVGDMEC